MLSWGVPELYKEVIINYDDVIDFGANIIQAFGERTDGKIKLNANEIEMDLSWYPQWLLKKQNN